MHLGRDLFQHLAGRHLVRQRLDHDLARFHIPHGPEANTAIAGFIDLADLFRRCHDFRFGRVVRSWNVFHQFGNAGAGFVQQLDTGVYDFARIVRRYVGRHADGDTGGTVEYDVG